MFIITERRMVKVFSKLYTVHMANMHKKGIECSRRTQENILENQ